MPGKPPCLNPRHAARPRRAVLAAVLVSPTPALAGQPPGPGPDQRLRALCDAALAADAAAVTRDDEDGDSPSNSVSSGNSPDQEVRAWRARQRAVSHLPALTGDGLRAKARLLLALQPRVLEDDPISTLDRLISEGAAEEALRLLPTLTTTSEAPCDFSPIEMAGYACRKVCMGPGSRAAAAEGTLLRVMWPLWPATNSDNSLSESFSSNMMRRAIGRSCRPAPVSATPRVLRSKSRAPSFASADAIVRLRAGCEMQHRMAEARKLRVSDTSTNFSSSWNVNLVRTESSPAFIVWPLGEPTNPIIRIRSAAW
jgi:hypothetical protein